MEYRTLDINVISGKDLQKVNLISKMNCYAVVFIDDGGFKPSQKKKTPVSRDTDAHPVWNCPMKFTIDESAARQNRLTLVFQVRCERNLGDRDVGEVRVPIKELFDSPAAASNDGKQQFVNYQVRKPSGKAKGEISLSYKIGEKVVGPEPVKPYNPAGSSQAYPPQSAYPPPQSAYPQPQSSYPPPSASSAAAAGSYPPPAKHGADAYPPPKYETPYAGQPATAYPAQGVPAQGYGGPPPPYGYPPQQQGYGGGYPPQGYPQGGGYGGGYPPQQGGYGYPQQVMQPAGQAPKKNKFGGMGMGLGAGLLGGALGGMLIGDMVSDSYDGGYDGGFDDGGGFDF